MAKFNIKESLDYAFKKTLEAENELREYLRTKDTAHLIYCINDLATAIREVAEVVESLSEKIESDLEYLDDRLNDLEKEVYA